MTEKEEKLQKEHVKLQTAYDRAVVDGDVYKQAELAREMGELQDRMLDVLLEPDYTTGRPEPMGPYEIMLETVEDLITECARKVKEAIRQQTEMTVEDMEESAMHLFYAEYHKED